MKKNLDVRRRATRSRGQALVEFGLILPVMLTLFGGAIDVARVYQSWITLQGATRDAAEYAATKATSSSQAQAQAQASLCAETARLAGFTAPAGNPSACTNPAITVTYSLSTTAAGASDRYPIATVTVQATFPFRTMFAYPLFTQNGAWTLTTSATYSIVQGR
jgi:Flp pilus assembly protein TadG